MGLLSEFLLNNVGSIALYFLASGLLLIVLFLGRIAYDTHHTPKSLSRLPSPPKEFFLGHGGYFIRNLKTIHDFVISVIDEFKTETFYLALPEVCWDRGATHCVVTVNPANVEYVLYSNFENFIKSDDANELVRPLFGRRADSDIVELYL